MENANVEALSVRDSLLSLKCDAKVGGQRAHPESSQPAWNLQEGFRFGPFRLARHLTRLGICVFVCVFACFLHMVCFYSTWGSVFSAVLLVLWVSGLSLFFRDAGLRRLQVTRNQGVEEYTQPYIVPPWAGTLETTSKVQRPVLPVPRG